jgi:hypothetical protein
MSTVAPLIRLPKIVSLRLIVPLKRGNPSIIFKPFIVNKIFSDDYHVPP